MPEGFAGRFCRTFHIVTSLLTKGSAEPERFCRTLGAKPSFSGPASSSPILGGHSHYYSGSLSQFSSSEQVSSSVGRTMLVRKFRNRRPRGSQTSEEVTHAVLKVQLFRPTAPNSLCPTQHSCNSSETQESPRQTKPKKGQFMNFSRGKPEPKFDVNRACFPKEKHQNSQQWAKFMNFSFWPFLWFGLPGRLLRNECDRPENRALR